MTSRGLESAPRADHDGERCRGFGDSPLGAESAGRSAGSGARRAAALTCFPCFRYFRLKTAKDATVRDILADDARDLSSMTLPRSCSPYLTARFGTP